MDIPKSICLSLLAIRMQFIFHLNSLNLSSGLFSYSKFSKCWWNHCTLLSFQGIRSISTFQQKIFQCFTLNFKLKFSLLKSHCYCASAKTCNLPPPDQHLLSVLFFLQYQTSITSFLLATPDSPFPWRLLHKTLSPNNCIFVNKHFICTL